MTETTKKHIPLALVAPGRRWHLVRDTAGGVQDGLVGSLCGRVWPSLHGNFTLSHEPQDWRQMCGHCYNVKLGIRDGRCQLKIAMTEAPDEPS